VKDAATILQEPGTYATSALLLLVDAFDVEMMEWDPVTLSMEIAANFGFEPSQGLLDRVNAASSLYTSNLFHLSLETFSAVCNSLNFGTVTSEMFLPADLDDILWGVTEAKVMTGDMFDDTPFSHNIARYVGALLSDEGIRRPPSVLEFAEYPDHEVDEMTGLEDDPEAFELYWQTQDEERGSLEQINHMKVMALFQQIAGLPLKRGSTEAIQQTLSQIAQKPA
jgi:hypothetical protein